MSDFFEKHAAKFQIVSESGCWIWTAGTRHGYGAVWHDGKLMIAHRAAYEAANGPVPDHDGHRRLFVCHTCDTRPCINPDHLFLGTHAENMADMVGKGRQVTPKGEKNGSAKLTEADVLAIRADMRTQKEIADDFRIHQSNVSFIKSRKKWSHL